MNRLIQNTVAGLTVGLLLAGTSYGQDLCPQLIGPPVDLSDGEATSRGFPTVARNSLLNEYMVVWYDNRNPDPLYSDIFGQRVAADGQRIGGNIAITEFLDPQLQAYIAYGAADNEYLVTWRTGETETGHFGHAHGRRVAADGSLPGGEFHVANSGDYGSLAYSPDADEFLYLGSYFGVSYRRVAEGGGPIGSETMMPDTIGGDIAGHVRYDSIQGLYFTTWRDSDDAELNGRLLTVTGDPLSLIETIGTDPGPVQPVAAAAFHPGMQRYLVAFGEYGGTTIRGRFVNSGGILIGSEFTIGAGAADSHGAYVVRVPASGAFLVAWDNGDGIVGQLVAADGALIGGAFVIAAQTGGGGPPHMVAREASNEVLVIWADESVAAPGQEDIFAQLVRVSTDQTGLPDCDGNGINDLCDLASGNATDCDANGIPDVCDPDLDADGTIDGCDDDMDGDGVLNGPDACDFTPPALPAQYIEPDGSVKGDLDGDCDVDLGDFAMVQVRFTGPNP